IFRSRDGKWMVIAANTDRLFRRLCNVMGRHELADDERFATHVARGQHQEAIERIVAEGALRHDAHEIDALLNDVGVTCGPSYTIADIFEDPHFREREMLVDHEDVELGTFAGPGVVPKLTRTPGAVRWSAPWAEGSHNDEVYTELAGLSRDELAELRDAGVV